MTHLHTHRPAGRHFLNIPGPTPVPERILRAIDHQVIDHRGPEFQALGLTVLAGMKEIFQTVHPVIIYPASGTGAWEATLVNTLSAGDTVLMAETGHFAALWHKMATCEDTAWTARYHAKDPNQLAFGGRVEITMQDGSKLIDELALANAHPNGAKPFARADYINKFRILTDGIITAAEADRFIEAAQNLQALKAGDLHLLNVALPAGTLALSKPGIF